MKKKWFLNRINATNYHHKICLISYKRVGLGVIYRKWLRTESNRLERSSPQIEFNTHVTVKHQKGGFDL
jgi:RNase P/RNase MRP subunit p30